MANTAYRNSGKAIIEKQQVKMLPIRNNKGMIISCKICEKSTVDYIGRLGNIPIAIEAKHTEAKSIRFDAVQEHQARFLEEFMDGGISIVLVSFDLTIFYAVPAKFWLAARKAWQEAQRKGQKKAEKILVTDNGQSWTTPGKASVTPMELLPEWRVSNPLKYLQAVENHIIPTYSKHNSNRTITE